jgi:thiol-disulfide isomerase/thioredoxin
MPRHSTFAAIAASFMLLLGATGHAGQESKQTGKDIDELLRVMKGTDWQATRQATGKFEQQLAKKDKTSEEVAGILLDRAADFVADAEAADFLGKLAKKGERVHAAALLLRIVQARQTVLSLKKGHVIVGQVVVEDGKLDPELVMAQMPISPEGYFAGEVGDLKRPVGFRAQGYEPVNVPLAGKQGAVVYVGQVKLKPLQKDNAASARARITLDGAKTNDAVEVSLSMSVDGINTPHNGYSPRRRWPEGAKYTVPASGEFVAKDLTPGKHYLSIKAKDHVDFTKMVELRAGEELDLKTVRLLCTDLGFYIGKSAPKTDDLKWEKDYAAALKKAQAEKKPIMVMMTATWCGPCKALEKETLNNPWTRHFLSGFVIVKAYEDKEVETKYGLNGYPTLVFTDSNGKEAFRSVGYRATMPFAAECAQAFQKLDQKLPPELQTLVDRKVLVRQ